MDAKQRTSKEIDTELQAERETIKKLQREIDTAKKEQATAEGQQERLAYKALAQGDKGAQKNLDEAEERLAKAERHIKSFEKAIAQGMQRFDVLEREWRKALADEAWAALMQEAELARKEADQIDTHIDTFSTLLATHGKRLEHLKNTAHDLGFETAFRTVGLRHVNRIFDWRLIQAGFAGEFEKPGPQYRGAAGYAAILAEQVLGAQAAHDAVKNREIDELVVSCLIPAEVAA